MIKAGMIGVSRIVSLHLVCLSKKEKVILARGNQGIRGILTVIGRRNNKLKWELID